MICESCKKDADVNLVNGKYLCKDCRDHRLEKVDRNNVQTLSKTVAVMFMFQAIYQIILILIQSLTSINEMLEFQGSIMIGFQMIGIIALLIVGIWLFTMRFHVDLDQEKKEW